MDNQTLIESFYKSFQNRDYSGMIACYHPDIHFSDPVFTNLQGNHAKAMWHMLCERGTDLQVTYSDVVANGRSATAHWEATYTFSSSKRLVHNIVDAQFQIEDYLIIDHQDSFDLWRWTRMALGPTGTLMGWTPMVQKKVRETAVSSLNKFITQHPEYQ